MYEVLPEQGEAMEGGTLEGNILTPRTPRTRGFACLSSARVEGGVKLRGSREMAEPVSSVKTCPVARQAVVSNS